MMIIKVPIYVEIESVETECLPIVVEDLSNNFGRLLRKEKFLTLRKHYSTHEGWETIKTFKILDREKALETLRVKQ